MSPTRVTDRMLQTSIANLRQSAWDKFVLDYVSAVDPDPGEARARYRAEMAEIEARLSTSMNEGGL